MQGCWWIVCCLHWVKSFALWKRTLGKKKWTLWNQKKRPWKYRTQKEELYYMLPFTFRVIFRSETRSHPFHILQRYRPWSDFLTAVRNADMPPFSSALHFTFSPSGNAVALGRAKMTLARAEWPPGCFVSSNLKFSGSVMEHGRRTSSPRVADTGTRDPEHKAENQVSAESLVFAILLFCTSVCHTTQVHLIVPWMGSIATILQEILIKH